MKKPEYKKGMTDAEYSVFLKAILYRIEAQRKGIIPRDPPEERTKPNKFLNPFTMMSE